MDKKNKEILLKLNKLLYKKKESKPAQNKKSMIFQKNINKEDSKNYNNQDNINKHYIPKRKPYPKTDRNERQDALVGQTINYYGYYSNKIINGSINNENTIAEYHKEKNKFKTINNPIIKNKNSIEVYRNGNYNIDNNAIEYYIDKNGKVQKLQKIYNHFLNNSKKINKPIAYIVKGNDNKNILIDLKGNVLNQNKNGDYIIFNDNLLIIQNFDVQHPELRINVEKQSSSFQDVINCSIISPNSPKLFFDYKRISNLLANNNSIENKNYINKTNNNLFRREKININNSNKKIKNMKQNIREMDKIYEQKKIDIYKEYSFNNNKNLINNDENNDDISINKPFKKEEINHPTYKILNYNNINTIPNIIERNNNAYFSPNEKTQQNSKDDYYVNANKPVFTTTENGNVILTSQFSSSTCNNNNNKTIFVNERKNGNKNNKNVINLNDISKDKYFSAKNIFNKNKKNHLRNLNNNITIDIKESRSLRNDNTKKRTLYKKINKYFNHYKSLYGNNNNPLPKKILQSNDSNDDINKDNINNISIKNNDKSSNNIKYINQIDEQKKMFISDYCSSYNDFNTTTKNKNKKKMYYINHNSISNHRFNKNNKNKIIIYKNINCSYKDKNEQNKNNNEDNTINNTIKKYKNINSLDSRRPKNKKNKNLIFAYERFFKHQNSFFKSKMKSKFINEDYDDKEDIKYTKTKSNKKKIKYLSKNNIKNKECHNDVNTKNENENTITNIFADEKNSEFDYNMRNSKLLLNNIKCEKNLKSYSFCKLKGNKSYINRLNKIKEKNISKKNKKLFFSIINKESVKKQTANKNNKNIFDNIKNNNNNKKKFNFYREMKFLDLSKNNNDSKEYMIIDNNSNINKELYNAKNNYNLDNDNEIFKNNINEEFFRDRKKPIIINNQSYKQNNIHYNNQKPRKRNNDCSINTDNNTINCCSNRYKNILNHCNNFCIEDLKLDSYTNKNVRTINPNNNLLLVTNVTKCPQCHCLFGQPSQLLNNNNEE